MTRSRVTVEIGGKLKGELERIAEKHGVAMVDVFRKGIALLMAAEDARNEGFQHIGAWKQEGNTLREREFILP